MSVYSLTYNFNGGNAMDFNVTGITQNHFDKENLSIVPSFIKSLLSYFNNVIIVSHIDLIQDNIDEIAEIKYNKINNISSMEYGNYKKVIKKRNRK